MRSAGVVLAVAATFCAVPAGAQTRLGEILDAGAQRVGAEEFRREVVQRPIVGPLEPGVNVEMIYTDRGGLEGFGSGGRFSYTAEWSIQLRGTWTFGERDSVCVTTVLDGPTIRATYPRRCRYWYKLAERYFVSDSDSDRQSRVLPRTVKP